MLKSTDGGANWREINNGLTSISSVTAIVVDRDNPSILYIGTSGGVFKSTDGGANWSAFNDGLTNLDIRVLTLAPGNPNTLYAGTAGGVFKITDNTPGRNSIDDTEFFVRQQYFDFLNREPDAAGLAFWKGILEERLNSCGTADTPEANTCRTRAKAAVSEAFFVSVEFQQTGYLVYRLYKSAFDPTARPRGLPRYSEFLRDAQQIGSGVIVNAPGWEQKLEANKAAFIKEFVQRSEFTARFSEAMTGEGYVNALLTTAGLPTAGAARFAAIGAWGEGGTEGRAAALRSIAESDLLFRKEFNQAFVLMQYFGYLRRGPDEGEDAPTDRQFKGYEFWLTKLNAESGDTTRFTTIDELLAPTKRAQMVEAFVVTGEYRRRFGPE
ncbi:MAG: hypothetical protein H0T92_23100 [Pyrinomonadaceae bacterium]|nr:hypothetical protein [Pyrinomonadaceae bacterium]